jgi:hypothetical protein
MFMFFCHSQDERPSLIFQKIKCEHPCITNLLHSITLVERSLCKDNNYYIMMSKVIDSALNIHEIHIHHIQSIDEIYSVVAALHAKIFIIGNSIFFVYPSAFPYFTKTSQFSRLKKSKLKMSPKDELCISDSPAYWITLNNNKIVDLYMWDVCFDENEWIKYIDKNCYLHVERNNIKQKEIEAIDAPLDPLLEDYQ